MPVQCDVPIGRQVKAKLKAAGIKPLAFYENVCGEYVLSGRLAVPGLAETVSCFGMGPTTSLAITAASKSGYGDL